MIFLANPLEVLRGLMNNGFLIICMFKKEVELGFTLIIYRRDSVLLQQVRRPFDIFICFSFPAAQ